MKRRLRCADDFAFAAEDQLRKMVHAEAQLARYLFATMEKFPESEVDMRREWGDEEFDEQIRLAQLYQELGHKEFKRVRSAELIRKGGGK